MRSDYFCSELPISRACTVSTSSTFHLYPFARRITFVWRNIWFCPNLSRESEKSKHARVLQEQLDLLLLNVGRFLERVKKDSQKKAPHVYPRVYYKATFIAPLILIGLSIRLRYHRNHDESFINSGDRCCVEFMSADRARESAPNVRVETYRSITSSGRYFSKDGIIRMFLSRAIANFRPLPRALHFPPTRTKPTYNLDNVYKMFLGELVEFDNFIERIIFFVR